MISIYWLQYLDLVPVSKSLKIYEQTEETQMLSGYINGYRSVLTQYLGVTYSYFEVSEKKSPVFFCFFFF